MTSTDRSHQNEPMACSINDTKRKLGIGRTKVYDLIRNRELETIKIGTRRLVLIRSIHALVRTAR
jgi:excisionase family DNA binding protein